MPSTTAATILAIAIAAVFCFSLPAEPDANFHPLFNGQDLTGWEGDPAFWSVRDGAIVGQTTAAKPAAGNTFLIWTGGEPANFELRLSFRMSAQNDQSFANSGIQYRSTRADPSSFVVGGYQADIDLAGKYIGMLYEERGRGLLMAPGERIRILPPDPGSTDNASVEKLGIATSHDVIRAVYRPVEWNEFLIIANGNHLRHYVDGTLTADVIDDDPAAAATSGLIALQLHQGPPMTIEFKNIEIKTTP